MLVRAVSYPLRDAVETEVGRMSTAQSRRPASTFELANARKGRLDSPLSVFPFFVAYLLPVVFLRSTQRALCNSWTCAWFVFAVLPVLEMVVPDDLANPTHEESRRAAKDWRYKIPLYLWALPQCAAIIAGAHAFCDADASLHRKLGLVLSAGVCTGGVGITVAHELLHKDNKLELFLAKFLLSSVCYAHFGVEHRFGHHRRVGTSADPATAARRQSFYAFWARSVVGTYRGAWRIWRGDGDFDFGDAAKRTFGRAFMRDAHLFPALWAVALFSANPRRADAVVFFLAQALVAATLLELVNYLEHYGLRRERVEAPSLRADPREAYEPVNPAHSWNAPQRVTNWFLFRLQRHSDHHARAATPYQALRTYAEAPTLPTGYAGMLLVALAPWWFEKCLGPVLDARRAPEAKVQTDSPEKESRKRRADADALARRRARVGVLVAMALVTAAAWAPTVR